MRQEEHSGQRNSVVQRPRDKRKQVARLGRWHLEFGSARKLLWAYKEATKVGIRPCWII